MNLRPRRVEDPDVSLTPLIDVVFLLLIFFMVSTTFQKDSELDIVLPEAEAEAADIETRRLTIAVTIDGRFSVNDEVLADSDIATLIAALNRLGGDDRDQPVVIRADAKATHQAVVTAMDAAGQAGFRRLGIVTTQRAGGQR